MKDILISTGINREVINSVSSAGYKDKDMLIHYLISGTRLLVALKVSKCQMCDQLLGTTGLTDGEWTWTSQLAHYVSEHNLKLPEEFVETIRDCDYSCNQIDEERRSDILKSNDEECELFKI
jgi:hypothetical protein